MSENHGQYSFFDLETRLKKIHEPNDFLPRLDALVDWEIFRYKLNKVCDKERLSNAGFRGLGVCRRGDRSDVEETKIQADDLREGLSRQSADGGTKGTQS